MKKEILRGLVLAGIILVAALSRILPHPMNFTPIVAISLFSAAYFKDTFQKYAIPFSIIVFSDLLIETISGYGFHSGTLVVYASFALIIVISSFILKNPTVFKVLASSALGSILFFLITNFALLYPEAAVSNPALGVYSHDFSGILSSYSAGLPFFRNMFVGDLIYTSIMFGLAYFIQNSKIINFKLKY